VLATVKLFLMIVVSWNVMPCSLVHRYQYYGGTSYLHSQSSTLKIQAAVSPETLVSFYQTTRCHIPEGVNININSRENLIGYLKMNNIRQHYI
jgi:hypothetical protein